MNPSTLEPSDPPYRSIRLPSGPLAYTDEGPPDAPTLVTVHGVPGSVRDFRHLAHHLTDAVRMIRVDLPGFGASPPCEETVGSLQARAGILLSLADALGLERFAVLGHSMGGGTALVAASAAPRRISLLVMVASVALSRHRGLGMPPWAFGLMARGLRLPALPALLLPLLRGEYRRRRFAGAEDMDRSQFALHFRSIAAVDFDLLRRAARSELPPTLLAYSRDDPMVQTPVSEELARELPHARVLAFDEGGHNLQKTRAAELAAAIRAELGLMPERRLSAEERRS